VRDDHPFTGRSPPPAAFFYSPTWRGSTPSVISSAMPGLNRTDALFAIEREINGATGALCRPSGPSARRVSNLSVSAQQYCRDSDLHVAVPEVSQARQHDDIGPRRDGSSDLGLSAPGWASRLLRDGIHLWDTPGSLSTQMRKTSAVFQIWWPLRDAV
jgi:hypothetical protein